QHQSEEDAEDPERTWIDRSVGFEAPGPKAAVGAGSSWNVSLLRAPSPALPWAARCSCLALVLHSHLRVGLSPGAHPRRAFDPSAHPSPPDSLELGCLA